MTSASWPPLCIAEDATFWAWRRWPEFSRWPDHESTLVVVPVAGLADWGLGHPLDAEETVLLSVLQAASVAREPGQSLLVTPPLRFVVGPESNAAFAVDVPTAHALIEEVVRSVVASGFRRIVLFNASPWNEEIVSAAARDLRVALGARLFTLQLSGLGLDFHPTRQADRRPLQTLLTGLTGRMPGPAAAVSASPVFLQLARTEAAAVIASFGRQVAALLFEMQRHPPLANHGRIGPAQP